MKSNPFNLTSTLPEQGLHCSGTVNQPTEKIKILKYCGDFSLQILFTNTCFHRGWQWYLWAKALASIRAGRAAPESLTVLGAVVEE